jgi:endonuclease-3
LGLIGLKVSAEQAHAILERLCPNREYGTFHINIIRHGREVCHARGPECERCPLQDVCDYYQKVMKGI